MDRAAAVLASIWAFIGNPQFPVIFVTAVIVTAGVLWGRRWYLAHGNGGTARSILADAFAVVAPYLARPRHHRHRAGLRPAPRRGPGTRRPGRCSRSSP